jgi:CheY-like chemotaxis protein
VKKRTHPTTILLLENEDDDVVLFRRALKELGFEGKLRVLASLAQAREYIEGQGAFADWSKHPLPDLIVSDSTLHDGTGVEFFHWVRTRRATAEVPFVLFTGFAPPAVGLALVNAGARAFITKSIDFDGLKRSVADMLEFLPPRASSVP